MKMRKIFAFVIAVMLFTGSFTEFRVYADTFSKAKAGDIITLGSYEQDNNLNNGKEPIEWIVLSKTDKELFVVSKYVLDCIPYNSYNSEEQAVTWETCSLRKWLNKGFYNTAFNKTEKKRIKRTTVKNKDNPKDGTDGGKNTKDRVFILSLDEVKKAAYGFKKNLSKSDINRRCSATKYALAQGVMGANGKKAKQRTKFGGGGCFWWLRTSAFNGLSATYVSISGKADDFSFNETVFFGVRPALKIRIG